MALTALVRAFIVLLAAIIAGQWAPTTSSDSGKVPPDLLGDAALPDFCIVRNTGNSLSSKDLSKHFVPNGLLFAMWKDGTIVSARIWSQPGENLQVSSISAEKASKFFDTVRSAELETAGFATTRVASSNCPETQMRFRDSKDRRRHHRWHERIEPTLAETDDPVAPEFVRFVKMWHHVMILVASTFPHDGKPIATVAPTGVFRGIKVENPSVSGWIVDERIWSR